MSGLFQRASDLVQRAPESNAGEELVFDEGSGISREDQKEILAEIDQVVEDNRIAITPDTLKIRAQKRGTLFPLLVNVFSVVLLVAGGFGFYLLFQRGESGLREEVGSLASAEGMLIEELKKESEARLLEKNREISQIQNRLEEIDQERQDLQSSMDARVAAREEELRSALESELAAERERLRQQGIAEGDISLRIQELEARRTEAYQQELSAFRQQAEEERRQAEANLAALREEYQQNLTQANRERSRVLEEAQAREAELRRQLAARTQALEQESQEARQELNRIAEQRDKEVLAAGQLVGFYDRVRDHMEGQRFEAALDNLDAIKEYLNDPRIAALPSMLDRREIEFFVVDSIASLVRSEMGKEQVDTASLIAAANVVTELKSRIVQADSLYGAGQVDRAEGLYREALAMIPEVSRTHEYFLARAGAAQDSRTDVLRDYLRRAESAFAGGDYEATLANYTRALEYLPEERAAVERLISQVRQAGFQLGLLGLRRDQSAAASEALARGNRLLTDGQHNAAITAYVELLRRYPNSDQVGSAVEGINRAAEAKGLSSSGDLARLRRELEARDSRIEDLESQLQARTAELEALAAQATGQTGDVAALREELARREQEIASLEAELEKWKGDAGELQRSLDERLDKLQEELDQKVAVIATLQEAKSELEGEMGTLREDIRRLQAEQAQERARAEAAETRAAEAEGQAQAAAASQQDSVPSERFQELMGKVQRLEAVESRYNRLVSEYRSYVSKEDSVLSGRGSSALVESKLHLNAFLSSAEESFPGLWERIKRYDEAFQDAGRAGATQEISDILYELSYLSGAEERARYLDREARRYPDDPLMLGFLEELKELPAGGTPAQAPTFNRYLDLLAAGNALDTSQMSLFDELALRSSRESRELYLETELLRNRGNTTLVRLIEDLLRLVRSE